MSLHLVAGRGVGYGLQVRRGLADEDIPFTGDGPDGLFGGRTLDPPGVTARHTQQRQLEAGRRVEADRWI